MARRFTASSAGTLVYLLISSLLIKDCQASVATTLEVTAGSETATGAEVILSGGGEALTTATETCSTCPSPATVDGSSVADEVKFTFTGLTPATHYEVTVAAGDITVTDTTKSAVAPPAAANICTKGADLALTIGTATETGIPVSWTVPTTGKLPTSYKLYIGTTLIHTIAAADVGDGEYTFTASDADGTALMMGTDYECKIVADIDAFGTVGSEECVASTVEDMEDCKLSSGAAFFVSNAALLGLLITKLFA